MNTPRRIQLLASFAAAAHDAGEYTDVLYRQAATIAWKIESPEEPTDADSREIWLELEDRLTDIGHETGWMREYHAEWHPDDHAPTG